MYFLRILTTFPEDIHFRKGFSSNCYFYRTRLSDCFCILCSLCLKTPTLAVFFNIFNCLHSTINKFGNILEESYETYNVTLHKNVIFH